MPKTMIAQMDGMWGTHDSMMAGGPWLLFLLLALIAVLLAAIFAVLLARRRA